MVSHITYHMSQQKILSYKEIHRYLHFSISAKDVSILQESIDLVKNPEQQAILRSVRDAKVNSEYVAMTHYRMELDDYAVKGCQECINQLNKLSFHCDERMRDTRLLYPDDDHKIKVTDVRLD